MMLVGGIKIPLIILAIFALLDVIICDELDDGVKNLEPNSVNDNVTIESSNISAVLISADAQEAELQYEKGMQLLLKQKNLLFTDRTPFKYIEKAVSLGHVKAAEVMSAAYALGVGTDISLERALALFQQLSDGGHPRGQLGLGLLRATGLGLNLSIPHAIVYLTFSALGGDELAEMALGYRYWAGVGLESDCETSLTYYRRVAARVAKTVSERFKEGGPTLTGPTVVRIHLLEEREAGEGLRRQGPVSSYLINEDIFAYYKFVADNNNVSAQVTLGQLYYRGQLGIEIDHEKAFHYFKKAARAGSHLAMAYIGEMYMVGSETMKADNKSALHYLQMSAAAENPLGLTSLGMAYLHGRIGLTRDPVKAFDLLLKASDQGWVEAQLQLGLLLLGTLGIKADYKLALKYLTLASQQGNTLAFYHLGQMHAGGLGVFRSCNTATELFKNVAERGRWSQLLTTAYLSYWAGNHDEAFLQYLFLGELGYEVAQSNAALMLEDGVVSLVPKSEYYNRSILLWKRSAKQGSTMSRVKLGDYYYYGLGTEVNYEQAVEEYRFAADMQRNAQAMFNLAYMHEQGLGFKRDLHLAKRFYDMAAEASSDAQIPVKLALLKLSLITILERLTNWPGVHSILKFLIPQDALPVGAGADQLDWDYYAIPLLFGLLCLLLLYLQQRRM